MSDTIYANFSYISRSLGLGEEGNYSIERNYAIRIYTNDGEVVPEVGKTSASLKGGRRTNNTGGLVPLLDGDKMMVGLAKVLRSVEFTREPESFDLKDIQACNFKNIDEAVAYAQKMHPEEYKRDNGVMTIYHYFVVKRFDPIPLPQPDIVTFSLLP